MSDVNTATETETGTEGGTGSTSAAIQAQIIDMLDAHQFTRPKSVSAASFKNGRALLLRGLRYLDADGIAAVAELALQNAQATKSWPAPATILAFAHHIFPDPAREAAVLRGIDRWMRCRVGRAALEGDYAVEMLATLRNVGPGMGLPSKIKIDRWREKAATRRFNLDAARRAGDADQVAYLQAAAEEARRMVMAAAPQETPSPEAIA